MDASYVLGLTNPIPMFDTLVPLLCSCAACRATTPSPRLSAVLLVMAQCYSHAAWCADGTTSMTHSGALFADVPLASAVGTAQCLLGC